MNSKKVGKLHQDTPVTWEEAVEQFIWWKQAGGFSQGTIDDYRKHISQFYKQYPEAYNEEALKKSILQYMAKPAKPAYFNLKLIYLRVFFNWCIKEGIYNNNPLIGIKKRKAEGRIVNLDEQILKELIELPRKDTFAGLRDYCLILLTLDSGIRPTEALSLKPADINLRALEFYVEAENAKTRVKRTLPISPAQRR